ncbi:MAG: transposase [Thermoleophilaceae bacterium]|nr:transposase [Thermoleophilaceae bacterium]
MPKRHQVKTYVPDSYYHVFNRGVNKRRIFTDSNDHAAFLGTFERYLSPTAQLDHRKRTYKSMHGKIELVSYCLMPNHFHLLLRQSADETALTQLMRMTMPSYVDYFNRKHNRTGALFEGRYLASLVDSDRYLKNLVAYIHLNPAEPFGFPHSSHAHYMGKKQADWISSDRGVEIFEDRIHYLDYLMSVHDRDDLLVSISD